MIQSDLLNETNVIGQTITVTNEDNKSYRKIAEIKIPDNHTNRHIVFYVHDGMFSGYNQGEHKAEGILNIMLRTENEEKNFTNYGDAKAEWLIVRENTDPGCFFLEVNDADRIVELWTNVSFHNCYQFTVLAEGDRLSGNKHYFTLYDKPQPGTPPTEEQGYRKVVSTVAKLLAPTEPTT